LRLHDWDVDFAAWCTYKYLNSGPGGIGGIFVHERHANRERLGGWWGHNPATRFSMTTSFDPIPGASGFQVSNPSVWDVIALHASLQVFQDVAGLGSAMQASGISDGTGGGKKSLGQVPESLAMKVLREKSLGLTNYLEQLLVGSRFYVPVYQVPKLYPEATFDNGLLDSSVSSHPPSPSLNAPPPKFTIITPHIPSQRGSQLSLLFLPPKSGVMERVNQILTENGIVADERQPDVIRFSPIAMYNSFEDVRKAAEGLRTALEMEEELRKKV
jgi:kynureninase